jgi:CBS domain-containing protein
VYVDREPTGRKDILLKEIMHECISVDAEAPARDALRIMLDNRIPAVPVIDKGGHLEGIITDALLLDSAVPRYLRFMGKFSVVSEEADKWIHYLTEAADKPVREVMSREVSQIELGHSEIEAAHRMVHDGVPSVVITENGKPVGIVNRLDLYGAIVGLDRAS